MSRATPSLWKMVRATPRIDAKSLARAVEEAVGDADDFRTRLLIRDSVRAIESHWGPDRLHKWLTRSPDGEQIRRICDSMTQDAAEEHGFPSLKRRIVDAVDPEDILAFLRDLSRQVSEPTRLIIGGAAALIVSGHLLRQTEDIDVVDEVPAGIRTQYELLRELDERYGLQLTHFQSHYLPAGWEQRVQSIGTFGLLQAFIIDVYDMFLTKLFSSRNKDRDDLRALMPHLDRSVLQARLCETTAAFRSEEKLRNAARQNWFTLFGDELPA